MAISVKWDNPQQTLILVTFEARWTYREFTAAVQQRRNLMASVSHKVDVIVDMSMGQFIPARMITTLITLNRHIPANRRLLIYVRAPGLFRTIMSTVANIVPRAKNKVHFVDTLSEAKALISKQPKHNGHAA